MSQEGINKIDTVRDVFILEKSGLPFYTTCFEPNLCQNSVSHELQSGFLAAFYSWSQELSQGDILKVEFSEMNMLFTKRDGFFSMISVAKSIDETEARITLGQIADIFESDFLPNVQSGRITYEVENQFTDKLLKLPLFNDSETEKFNNLEQVLARSIIKVVQYQPGVCNIGTQGRKNRVLGALLYLIPSIIIFFITQDVNPIYIFAMMPFLFGTANLGLQAYYSFCVTNGKSRKWNLA